MDSFGEYLREQRDNKGLPLRKVAAELDIDTSILSKIERNEREATKEMLPIFSKVLERDLKEVEVKYILHSIMTQFSEFKHLKDGLNEALKSL
ncbi:MAG: helix-turn-helix domain-containing protein [Cyclobacteriaceae bacterium]